LVRGKYIERLRTSSNVVVIDPEVTDLFPNAAEVNAALRSLAEIAKRARSESRKSPRRIAIAGSRWCAAGHSSERGATRQALIDPFFGMPDVLIPNGNFGDGDNTPTTSMPVIKDCLTYIRLL
jgi:hypothetical protein